MAEGSQRNGMRCPRAASLPCSQPNRAASFHLGQLHVSSPAVLHQSSPRLSGTRPTITPQKPWAITLLCNAVTLKTRVQALG